MWSWRPNPGAHLSCHRPAPVAQGFSPALCGPRRPEGLRYVLNSSELRSRSGAGARVPAIVALLVAAALQGACGYSLAGRGSFLPASIKTIAVPLFTNQTSVFEVEQQLTDKVRSELIGRGKYRVVPETTGADASLIGTITSISLAPSAFNDQRQATRYAVTVVVSIEFRDLANDKVLWSNPALSFREEYEVTTGTDALDPNAFFGQNQNAFDRLSQDFARTVVSAILEAF
jgi:outer membrane lipopolysaccharide assembly protein LptE/RlpB